MKYQVHTKKQLYVVEAGYFKAIEMGVMFFDNRGEGIGFVPHVNLEIVRLDDSEKDISLSAVNQELIRKHLK